MSKNTFIATKNRGHNELVKNGINGFLVELGDYKTLANYIILLIQNNELKRQLEDNAIKMIQPYTLNKVLVELEQVFDKVLV
jgi:glycosyltransferase EpsD